MKLITVSHSRTDIPDRQLCQLQKLSSFYHTVAEQKFLGSFSDCFFEYLAEITSVESAYVCNILNGNIILEIMLDEFQCFMNIKVTQLAAVMHLNALGGTGKIIYKQEKMTNKMKRR